MGSCWDNQFIPRVSFPENAQEYDIDVYTDANARPLEKITAGSNY